MHFAPNPIKRIIDNLFHQINQENELSYYGYVLGQATEKLLQID